MTMKKRRFLSVLLTLALLLSLLPGMTLTAYADTDPVPYMAWDETSQSVKAVEGGCAVYEVVTANTTAFEDGKWYVVNETVTNNNRISVNGTANLILMDGKTLTAPKGINVNSVNSVKTLNIYAQSEDKATMGAISINGVDEGYAAIGSDSEEAGGTVNIHGGKITATGRTVEYQTNINGIRGGAGIGTGNYGDGGSITIYGGNITAKGGTGQFQSYGGAGIGAGYDATGGSITIYGGEISATGGASSGSGGAGIGGGAETGGGNITIYGGKITANGGVGGAGIGGGGGYGGYGPGGIITIYGGEINATGGEYPGGAGIGGGRESVGGTVTIYDGTVVARGSTDSAGIGGGKGKGGTVTIHGGTVTATGGSKGAGIGGGQNNSGNVTIDGGTVTSNGGSGAAGIGAGANGGGGTVTIGGGTVTATGTVTDAGTAGGAGIGGGNSGACATVTITGGTVKASGSSGGGMGIGAGAGNTNPNTGDVTINGGEVSAYVTSNDGIFGLNVTIDGGTVTANRTTASNGNSGICASVNLTISGGIVESSGFDYGLYAGNGAVTITAGDVTVSGGDAGILANNNTNGGAVINGGNVTVSGETHGAFYSDGSNNTLVKNTVDGIGWENAAGTEGKTAIETSTDGQPLSYKKVRFPAAVASVTTKPTANELTYTGLAQELVTAGTAEGGTMQYAYSTAYDVEPDSLVFAEAIPKATDVGAYYVWYKAVGDAYHLDSDVYRVSADISKASITITVKGDQKTFTYDGTKKTAEGYTVRCDDELYDASKLSFTGLAYVTGTDVGNYPMGLQASYFTYNDTNVTATFDVIDGKLTINAQPSYSGVGGSPATYKVILPAQTAGGKLTVSPEKAAKGAKVTITATPDEGYKAVKPTVTDADGKAVEVTENADGTWTFAMPGSDATVSGGFEKAGTGRQEKFVDVPADAWYHDDVYWALDNGVTTGVDDTHFAPDADCTRAQFVTFLWRAAGKPTPTSTVNPFEDVAADAYYYDAVLWAVEKGVTNGTDAAHFTPDAPVTRAEAMTFLYRYEQSEGRGFTGLWAFPLDYPDAADVPDWAYEAFCWMVKEDICKGSDGMLLPGALCRRCEIAALLARCFAA